SHDRARLRRAGVLKLKRPGEYGIEAGERDAARLKEGADRKRGYGDEHVGLAKRSAGRTALDRGQAGAQCPAGLGSPQIRIGNQRTVTLDFDGVIILDRQRDGVFELEV